MEDAEERHQVEIKVGFSRDQKNLSPASTERKDENAQRLFGMQCQLVRIIWAFVFTFVSTCVVGKNQNTLNSPVLQSMWLHLPVTQELTKLLKTVSKNI